MSTSDAISGFIVAIIVAWQFGFLCGVIASQRDVRAARRERESRG